jgi:precorrin-6A/cobalt-precorrin-6A reductase
MILLFGGTSDTAQVAQRIAEIGHDVTVSTATDINIDIGDNLSIKRVMGRMTLDEIKEFIHDNNVQAVVDTTHPYATIVRANARRAADETDTPYLTFVRPALVYDCENIIWADDYQQAAQIAFSFGKTVLTTTGSKNIEIFAAKSKETGVKMVARVLDYPDSIKACREAGLDDDCIIAKRGPFTVESNLEHLKQYDAYVVVTKDSGLAGGVPEKVEAVRRSDRKVVMIKKPDHSGSGAFESVDQLIEEFERVIKQRVNTGEC